MQNCVDLSRTAGTQHTSDRPPTRINIAPLTAFRAHHVIVYYDCRYNGKGGAVSTIGIRDLANHTSAVVDEVSRTGRPALVTRNGRPVAVLAAIDEDELLDFVLASAPEYVRSMRAAEREIAQGQRGRQLDDVLSGLEDEAKS